MIRIKVWLRIGAPLAIVLLAACHDVPEFQPCDHLDCGPLGECAIDEETGRAICECDVNAVDDGLYCRNPCETVTCSNHGTCALDEDNEPYCECEDGYTPQGTNCVQDVFASLGLLGDLPVDILVVVDNSTGMSEEQDILAAQMAVTLEELVSPAAAGTPAIRDLHLGVVTTNVGAGGHAVIGCEASGDGGALQNVGDGTGCSASYSDPECADDECPWLAHSLTAPDDGTETGNAPVWDDFGCISMVGTEGCGYEQPFEASYQALIVQTGAGMPNEGFLRDDSLIVIVYVSDEDDCSANDTDLFNPARDDLGASGVRCSTNRGMLHGAASRYFETFAGLRPGQADRVIVAAITGVPIDGTWDPGDSVADLEALAIVDPGDDTQMVTSCDTANGPAYHPVRFAELTEAFGDNGILGSICRDDWSGIFESVTARIQEELSEVCVSDDEAYDPADCRVVEVLEGTDECPNLADSPDATRTTGWQVDRGIVAGHRVCEILPADYDDGDQCPDGPSCSCTYFPNGAVQAATGECLQGWLFHAVATDSGGTCNGVRLTTPDLAESSSTLRFECMR